MAVGTTSPGDMESLLRSLRERVERLERKLRLPVGEDWRIEQDSVGDIVVVNAAGESYPLNREAGNGVVGADGQDGPMGATGATGPAGLSAGLAWGFDGPLVVSSGFIQRTVVGTISSISLSLAIVGSSDTVVNLYKNGASVATVTLVGTSSFVELPVSLAVADNDALVPVIVTPGTGATQLTVQVEYQ